MDLNSYKNLKVLVTGHTGFKGGWMTAWLSQLGAQVTGYALKAPEKGIYNDIGGDELCTSIIGDIRDSEKLNKVVRDLKPDVVFHMAAQPLVRDSYEDPVYTFDVNAVGTAALLNAVRISNHPCCVVAITTDKVYHNEEWIHPYRESDRLGGFDPYSASKGCSELIIDSFRNSFFKDAKSNVHLVSVRAGNVIGGGDWAANRIIPDCVNSLMKAEAIVVRNPEAVRPWQHVLEPIGGYLKLGLMLKDSPSKVSDAYNFGPQLSDNLTVGELVEIVIKKWGSGSVTSPKPVVEQPHEANLLRLDISKAISELNWIPSYTADKAIETTVDWYKATAILKKDPRTITYGQISAYCV